MSNDIPFLVREESWVGVDVNELELMEDEGEASSVSGSVEVSEEEGSYQIADVQGDENSSRKGADFQEDSNSKQQGASGERLTDPEDSTIQLQKPPENMDDEEKVNVEFEHSQESLVPDVEKRDFGENFLDYDMTQDLGENILDYDLAPPVTVDEEEASASRDADESVQDAVESYSLGNDAPTDGVSDTSSLKNYEHILDSSDMGLDDLDTVDHIDIDFDQFGAQPPDLPIIDALDNEETEIKVNRDEIGSSNGEERTGESTEAEHQKENLDAGNEVEQEMKELNDGPVKTSLKDESDKEQLEKERDLEPDLDSYRIAPNSIEDHVIHRQSSNESINGPGVLRALVSEPIADEIETGEPSSAISTRLLRSKTGVEGFPSPVKNQKLTEELNQLTQKQAKQLEDIRHQVNVLSLKRKLETECDGRLVSEVKLMVLHEMLPNVEEKLKILCDQVLFLEVQLDEQVEVKNKLKEILEHERNERVKYDSQVLKEEIDLKAKVEKALEHERNERLKYAAIVEEKTRLHEELTHRLEEQQDERMKSEAGLMVLREILPNAEEKLKDLCDQVESLNAQLREQTELRKEFKEKLDWEHKERMQHMAKMEEQTRIHEELARKLEEEHDERLISETSLKELLHERLPNDEELRKDLHDQVMSLSAQLLEQTELRKELEESLEREREERKQGVVMVADPSSEKLPVSSMPWSEEKLEFTKLLDEQKTLLAIQMKEAEKLKSAAQMKVGLLNHQVHNLEVLSDIAETMESIFSAKERAVRQALWTAFQAMCLGMGFMYFVVAYRDSLLRSSLQPT